jgi:hypothetical protein
VVREEEKGSYNEGEASGLKLKLIIIEWRLIF